MRQYFFWPFMRRLPPDDFIQRLRCSVIGEGMLHEGNIFMLDYAVRHLPAAGSVIEIGSYGGLSTNLMAYLLQKHQKCHPFFTCDAWVYEGYHDHKNLANEHIDGRTDVLRTDYMQHIKSSFIQSVQLLSGNRLPHTIHARSDDFFNLWSDAAAVKDVFGNTATLGGPVAFAYIDGDHSYEAARRDFENIDRYLLPGGFILLDDSASGSSFGSAKWVQEVIKTKKYKAEMRNPNYLLQKKA